MDNSCVDKRWGKLKKIFFFTMLILILIPLVSAERTTRTISYFGGFVADAQANTPYSKTFTFKAPDGISQLYYVKAIIRADMTTTDTRVYVQTDGQFCDPNYYDVPTNERGYVMMFDCTDVVHGVGQYEVGFQANKDMKNVYAEWEFTYLNNPPSLVASIGGTEYRAGETSRIVLQILNNEGNSVNNGNCKTTVRDSNDMKVVNNANLNYINESNGIYFYEFDVELPTGVYSVDSWCNINGTKIHAGDTFHVAEWAEDIRRVKNVTDRPYISFVGGTEYTQDEAVGIRVQFLKADGSPITPYNPDGGGKCKFDLFHPNYTQILDDYNMTFINNSNGIFAYDWNESKDLGIYTVDVYCSKNQAPAFSSYLTSTFHVSAWGQGIINMTTNGTVVNEYYLLFAGGTEYVPNELSTLTVQFMRTKAGNPSPINDADWCRADIFLPNMSLWMDDLDFPYLSGSNALYYNRTVLPSIYGVYTIDAQCKKGGIETYVSHTFHVVPNISHAIEMHNKSIWGKLYNIQGELVDIEDAIIDVNFTMYDHLKRHNKTVMEKLYKIQDEIVVLGQNVTNISLEIVANMTDLPKEVYLYFDKAEERLIFNHDYCLNDNVTLRKELLIEKCVAGDCWNQTRNEDKVCPYGCDPETNKCKDPPWMRWLIIIGIIVAVIILVMFINWLIYKFEWMGVR